MIEAKTFLAIVLMMTMMTLKAGRSGNFGDDNLDKVMAFLVCNAFLAIFIPFILIGMFLFDLFF